MAQGYINAIQKHAPQADLVFDRFHFAVVSTGVACCGGSDLAR